MKCTACKYVYENGLVGNEEFVGLNVLAELRNFYGATVVEKQRFFACPKCGTLKIDVIELQEI